MALSERYSTQITRGTSLADRLHMKASSPRILALAFAFGVVAAGCGGVTLHPSDGGSNAGHGGGSGSTGGHPGSAGTGGSGGTPCAGLDENTCGTRLDCTSQYCRVCPKQQPTFAGCAAPGAPPVECPGEECVEVSCGTLDEASCKTRSDCEGYYCPGCVSPRFVGCGVPGGDDACPAVDCAAPCSGLDETTCNTRSDCKAGYCTGCSRRTFVGCGDPSTAFVCTDGCQLPGPCRSEATAASCDTRTDCHSVFTESVTCDCAVAGCCATFAGCADGAKASCTGTTPLCKSRGPYCDGVAYVVSYTASCFEGCVRPSECGP